MSQQVRSNLAILLVLLVFFTGCHPTQPFYAHQSGDLSKYLDTATEIAYPDSTAPPTVSDAIESLEPLNLRNMKFEKYWDLTLEDCVAIALQNSKVIRGLAQVQQFSFSSTGTSRVPGAATIFDAAISESTATPSAHQVDGNGNRVLGRGAARAASTGGVADALSEFDAQLFSSLNYSTTDRARNVGLNNQFNQRAFNGSDSNFLMSLSKRNATGAVWSARYRQAYSENNIPTVGGGRAVPSDWTAIVEFEVNQPLLRGAGVLQNRIPVVLARTRTDIALADLEASVRNLVMDVERTYWDLYCAYQIVEANEQGRDAALRAWQKDRARSGRVDPGEQEPRSRGQMFQFQSRVEAALSARTQGTGVFRLERQLRNLMGIPATDGMLMRPVDEPTSSVVAFDWREVASESLFRSPELRRQKWVVKQRELELISARNQLLPDLTLTGQYRYVGVGDELINADRRGADFIDTPTGSLAWDELTGGQFQEGFLGLTFTPNTIGARRQHSLILNANLELKKANAQLVDMEYTTINDLSDAVSDLYDNYRLAQLALDQLRAADTEVAKLEAKQGVVERIYDQLLDSHNRRATARIEYYQRLCDYNKAIAFVHFIKGSLLQYNDVHMAEGPWPQKAYWDATERARERDASYYLKSGTTRPGVVSQGPVPHEGLSGDFHSGHAETVIDGHQANGEAEGFYLDGEVVEGRLMDGQVVPGEAVPGEAVPGEVVPGEVVPGEVVPGEMMEGGVQGEGLGQPGGASPSQPRLAPQPDSLPAPSTSRAPEGPELNAPLRAQAPRRSGVQQAAFEWMPSSTSQPAAAPAQRQNGLRAARPAAANGNPLR